MNGRQPALPTARVLAPAAVETLVNLGMAYGHLGQFICNGIVSKRPLSLALDHPRAQIMRQALGLP